jgi:hypothetical protein
MKIELVQTHPKEQTSDKIFALCKVLEIVTDPGRIPLPKVDELRDRTVDKLLNLINGVSTSTVQEGNN